MTGRRADCGWLGLAVYVLGHNIRAAGRGDEMLSETFDRYRVAHPLLAHAGVLLVGLHLLRRLPPVLDPLGAVMGTLARKIGPLR